ncbi:MAG: hypothetical protein KME46_29695 [Brasilonema angustatum HA4187-MV1]|jgi:pantoate kinase|nr:hypothetical protein [Brasilonema angustatum HA4187-MV1]
MSLQSGSFGTITFAVPEVLKIAVQQTSGYVEIPIINGFSRVHWISDELDRIKVDFKFSSMPGVGYNTSAKARLDLLRAEKGSTTPKALTIAGENFGNYLVKSINWEVISQAGTMKPIVVTAQVEFLANPI